MRPHAGWISLLSACGAVLLLGGVTPAPAQETHVGNLTGHTAAGKPLYIRYCAGCHGDDGDAQGENAQWIDPKPRDFTLAAFKCRSTPTGTLPTDEDLFNSITRGFVTTNMPPWPPLTQQNRADLVAYIKTFSPRWKTARPGTPITIPQEPAATIASILHGREMYQNLECWKCHGSAGHGDGPSSRTLTDNRDNPMRPYNFETGSRFMCGVTNQDLYRVFMTGLDGSAMPSFADQIRPAEAWDLVHFLRTFQTLKTRESAIWRAWLATHAGELKPIGPEGGQR